jgi:hypothetical protein
MAIDIDPDPDPIFNGISMACHPIFPTKSKHLAHTKKAQRNGHLTSEWLSVARRSRRSRRSPCCPCSHWSL